MKSFRSIPLATCICLVACNRQPQQQKASAAEGPAFKPPSATEAFNLRTKCAELAETLNSQYDKPMNELWAATKQPLMPLSQEHFSHYDPRKNRCYVELRVKPNLFALMAPRDLPGYMTREEFWKRFDPDYVERTVYDGQTGEELAYAQNGVKGHPPVGSLKGEKVEWSAAYSRIDQMMDDE